MQFAKKFLKTWFSEDWEMKEGFEKNPENPLSYNFKL